MLYFFLFLIILVAFCLFEQFLLNESVILHLLSLVGRGLIRERELIIIHMDEFKVLRARY